MTFVAGVDGGGTRTRAVILDRSGRELGRAEAPGAVVTADDPGLAARAVTEAVGAAAELAGVSLPAAALWAGLAGAGEPVARAAVLARLEQAGLATRTRVGTDAEAAFHDALGDRAGIMLIAGTGSIAWARSEDGREVRVGGWGRHLGDEGSGFAIGLEALRRVTRAEDGRGPTTALRAVVLAACGVGEVPDLIGWVGTATKGDVAALARLVVDAGSAGDAVAADVVGQAVVALAAHVTAVLDAAGPWTEPPSLVLWGGLLAAGGPLRAPLLAVLPLGRVRPSDAAVDAPAGAARLALAALASD